MARLIFFDESELEDSGDNECQTCDNNGIVCRKCGGVLKLHIEMIDEKLITKYYCEKCKSTRTKKCSDCGGTGHT